MVLQAAERAGADFPLPSGHHEMYQPRDGPRNDAFVRAARHGQHGGHFGAGVIWPAVSGTGKARVPRCIERGYSLVADDHQGDAGGWPRGHGNQCR